MKIAMKIFAVFAAFAVGASARVLLDDSCSTADCCNAKYYTFWSRYEWEGDDWCRNTMPCGNFTDSTDLSACCELRVIDNKSVEGDAVVCDAAGNFPLTSSCAEVKLHHDERRMECCLNRLLGDHSELLYNDLEEWCKTTYTCKQLYPGDDKIAGFRICCDARKDTPDAWPEEPQCAS